MIGETISHYRILSLLGSGGMGVVFEAQDTILERKVAIKFLSTTSEQSGDAGRRLQREARTLSSLNHPNICTVYELKEHNDRPYLVEELLVGSTFQEVIDKGKLDAHRILELAIQIADGLGAAHASGIVHRDIKPANLFMTHGNRAKILDFGLARPSADLLAFADEAATLDGSSYQFTSPPAIVGTLAYMSPEQVRGEPATASSDIFSLGVVLYQLLHGKHPFKKDSLIETASAILMAPFDSRSSTQDLTEGGLNAILAKMLTKDAVGRYANGEELLLALRSLRSGLPSLSVGETCGWPMPVAQPSIAILPFLNLSADPENEYFCDGLAEELVGALTRVEGLKVAAWNSAFRFRGTNVNLRKAGKQLGVGAILEGSMRKSGNRLRVTAKLLDVKNGYSLWSDRYDGDLEDVFALQEKLAEAITSQLVVKLGLKSKHLLFRPSTRNIDAYNLYLRGRYFWNRRGPADIQKALMSFQQAIEQDKLYAAALAGVADCYVIAGVQGAQDPNDVFPLAREAVSRALSLEPEMPDALASLACVEAVYDWNWASGEQRFERSIELNPNYGTAHHWYATHLLVPLGRFAQARKHIALASANDPLSLSIQITAGLISYFERETNLAIFEYRKALEMDSNFSLAHYFLGQAYEQNGSYEKAIASLTRALELSPNSSETEAALARVYSGAGEHNTAEERLQLLRHRAETQYVSPVLFAQILLSLDRPEDAIVELQRAHQMKATDLMWLKVRPAFDDVREDPRVQHIAKSIGLA